MIEDTTELIDRIGVDISTITNDIHDLHSKFVSLRDSTPRIVPLSVLDNIPHSVNGTIQITELPTKEIKISYIKNRKYIIINREILLLIFLNMPFVFNTDDVNDYLMKASYLNFRGHKSHAPRLIMWFFAEILKDHCKFNRNNGRLVIKKNL